MRIAVTSGYSKSLHAAALVVALKRAGHDVGLCLNVRVLSAGRLRFYTRQLGWRRLWSKFRSRTLDDAAPKTAGRGEIEPMRDWMRENRIEETNVPDACRASGTKLVNVADLNSPAAIAELKNYRPDLVVYAGGGIVRKPFLETPRIGVLNAHGGPLPRFRGMNAAEWSVLHGVPPSVCVIFLDAGIDTGPIVLEKPIPLEPCVDVPTLRGWGTRMSVVALLEAVEKVAQPDFTPTPQDKSAGKQYFIMAHAMLPIVERRLAAMRDSMKQ
ncbi:MAG: hypothetical protein AMXMBFR47_26180 [Planctomycetota bacterium]